MAEQWQATKLGALGEFRNGVNFNRGQEGSGLPVVKVKDFGSKVFAPASGLDELSIPLDELPQDQLLKDGDIIIIRSNGNSALVGRSVVFQDAGRPTTFSGFCIRFRPDKDRIDPAFAAYYLRSPFVRQRFSAFGSGTGIQNLSQSILAELPLKLPEMAEQREIAEVLRALDDKIELNRRMNETLEATVRAIFTLQVEGSDTFQKSKFSRIATVSRDIVNPSVSPAELFDHYSIPAYDETRLPVVEQGTEIRSNKFIVYPDSVLLSKLNPRIPRIWMPNIGVERRSICSTEFLVLRPSDISSREFIYGFCRSVEFQDRFRAMVTGTSGSHQRVQPDFIEQMEVGLPPVDLVRKYSETVAPLHRRCANNLSEGRTLAILRDTLLPRLISGRLRIRSKEEL
jgi:type I restriction enzyme S subunit